MYIFFLLQLLCLGLGAGVALLERQRRRWYGKSRPLLAAAGCAFAAELFFSYLYFSLH